MQEIGNPLLHVPDAGLVAADACPDVVDRVPGSLVGELGVADLGPSHTAEIRMPGGENRLGRMRLIDAARDEHGNGDHRLDLRGDGRKVAGLHVHRRHDMNGAGETGHGAADDVDEIELAIVAQARTDIDDFVGLQTAEVQLVPGDAYAYGERVARALADTRDRLAKQAHSIVEITAVPVDALVDAGIQKLCQQQPMARHDLDAVEASVHVTFGRGAESINDLGDQLQRHGARNRHESVPMPPGKARKPLARFRPEKNGSPGRRVPIARISCSRAGARRRPPW